MTEEFDSELTTLLAAAERDLDQPIPSPSAPPSAPSAPAHRPVVAAAHAESLPASLACVNCRSSVFMVDAETKSVRAYCRITHLFSYDPDSDQPNSYPIACDGASLAENE